MGSQVFIGHRTDSHAVAAVMTAITPQELSLMLVRIVIRRKTGLWHLVLRSIQQFLCSHVLRLHFGIQSGRHKAEPFGLGVCGKCVSEGWDLLVTGLQAAPVDKSIGGRRTLPGMCVCVVASCLYMAYLTGRNFV